MKVFADVCMVLALLGCYGCRSATMKKATADALPSIPDVKTEGDVASVTPDVAVEDDVKADSDVASVKSDAEAKSDVSNAKADVANTASGDAGVDSLPSVPDTNADNDVPAVKPDTAIEAGTKDASEQCSCGSGSPVMSGTMSWTCFCSIENCGRKISDFVDIADGGRTLRSQTVMLSEYADCNLVFIKEMTYSDYVPPSEYIFDRKTGVLLGAKVQLDDREHICPFPPPDGSAGWVLSYQSGDYPVPATCQVSTCMGSASACAGAVDAQ